MQQQRSTTSIRRKAEERLSGAQMSLAAAKCMHADSIAAVRSADRCAAYVAGIVDDHSRSRCTSSATDHVHWLRGSIAATTSSAADVARSISDPFPPTIPPSSSSVERSTSMLTSTESDAP
jgi:hypothetical protein